MTIDALYRAGIINALDWSFARMIRRLDSEDDPWVALAAALVSRATGSGDICLDLELVCRHGIAHAEGTYRLDEALTLEQWRKALSKCRYIGSGDPDHIMILDGNRLYLKRYWGYESQVAAGIIARCRQTAPKETIDTASMSPTTGDPGQTRAIEAALRQHFTVITGGPGTGKTFTIATIITLLNRQGAVPAERMMLAAPTGKAAARLQEALARALRSRGESSEASEPVTAMTIHRLLGAMANSSRFRHNKDHPLAADLVIIDEASMIDLALMAKLLDAVSPESRLVLVGDKDQLASVEAGAVLGDICAGFDPGNNAAAEAGSDVSDDRRTSSESFDLTDHIKVLEKNYRFAHDSGIHLLGQAVKQGDADGAVRLLSKEKQEDIGWRPLHRGIQVEALVKQKSTQELVPLFSLDRAADLLRQSMQFKILTAFRRGSSGSGAVNRMVERSLIASGAIGSGNAWYHGKPVLITRNDYHQNLFNGDIGVAVSHDSDGPDHVRVAFANDGQAIQYLAPQQLPPHETVYAMTVHKSQGTEFDRVVLILPDQDSPILTRELIYTAITRAKQHVEIWSSEKTLRKAIGRRILRASGLRDALWGRDAHTGL